MSSMPGGGGKGEMGYQQIHKHEISNPGENTGIAPVRYYDPKGRGDLIPFCLAV